MAADERSNRVEVQLRLLEDKNLDRLEQVFKKFETQVDTLLREGIRLQGGGGGPTRRGMSQVAQGASIAGQGKWQPSPGGGMIFNTAGDGGGGAAQTSGPNPQASIPARQGPGWLASQGFNAPGMTEFERAQFSLGMLGQGNLASLRYGSHVAQRIGFRSAQPGETLADGTTAKGGELVNRQIPGGALMRQAGGAMGLAARVGTYGQGILSTVQQLVPVAGALTPAASRSMTQYGINVGYAGQPGSPISGPLGMIGHALGIQGAQPNAAWQAGFNAQVRAFQQSRWGGGPSLSHPWSLLNPMNYLQNPNYSYAQAQEAMGITNQYGWTGSFQTTAADMMKKYTKRYGGAIPQEMIMQMLEPVFRYGTGSTQQVEDNLTQLAAAAQAAHMNLSQFAQEAVAAAQQLSDQLGSNSTVALGQISAASAVTGLPPSQAAEIMGNTRNQLLGAAMTGQSLYQVAHGSGAAQMQAMTGLLGPFGDPKYWARLGGPDSPAFQQAWFALKSMYMKDPSILGGMTPDKWIAFMKHAGAAGVTPQAAMQAQFDAKQAFRRPADYAQQQERIRTLQHAVNTAPGWAKGDLQKQLKQAREDLRMEGWVADPAKMQAALREGGVSSKDIRGLMQYAQGKHIDSQHINNLIRKLHLSDKGSRANVLALAENLLGGKQARAQEQGAHKTQVQIGVKPPYDQIFKAMIQGQDASGRNSRKWYSRQAIGGDLEHIGGALSKTGVGASIGLPMMGVGAALGW